MPAAADLRAPAVSAPRRPARVVLLAALALGLAGLALPGSTAAAPALRATAMSVSAPMAAEPLEVAPPHPVRLLSLVPPRLVPRTASRSRPLVVRWVRPVSAAVVSPYGPRWGGWHPGIDFGAPYGAPIHAVGPGVVVGAGFLAGEDGYGRIILIQHPGGAITAYAHTSRAYVHAGQRVVAGQVIGLVGATGDATGPHLHFEVRVDGRKINPVPWLRAHGVYV